MRPSISIARRACEEARARQAIVVVFDGDGRMAVVSYGVSKKLCHNVRVTCDAIADGLEDGSIPAPATEKGTQP